MTDLFCHSIVDQICQVAASPLTLAAECFRIVQTKKGGKSFDFPGLLTPLCYRGELVLSGWVLKP
jgi:hypothetical protein